MDQESAVSVTVPSHCEVEMDVSQSEERECIEVRASRLLVGKANKMEQVHCAHRQEREEENKASTATANPMESPTNVLVENNCGSASQSSISDRQDEENTAKLRKQDVRNGEATPPGRNHLTTLAIFDPEFPIYGLPTFLQQLIKKCFQVYQTPKDFWAAAIFIATAAGTGNSIKLRGKYLNNPALWWLFVAPSGVGKSEPLDFALKPLLKLDAENYNQYRNEKRQYENIEQMTPRARRENNINNIPDLPHYCQTVLNDFTPEALVKVHSDNPRGICVYRDEFMGSIKDIGRYAKSGEVEFMLSIWSGKSAVVNRRSQELLRIDNPCVTMAGGIQERLIQTLAKEGRADNGMIPRFMFVWPERAVKPEYSDEVLPQEFVRAYDAYIANLVSITGDNTISLDPEAEQRYAVFYNQNARAANREKEDFLKEMYAKLDIIVLRLALIVHTMKIGCGEMVGGQIDSESMSYAIHVTEYFRRTARKALQSIDSKSQKMSTQSLIRVLRTDFCKSNQSEIARFLNVSTQYVNKVFSST